jgi:hypothetical protein
MGRRHVLRPVTVIDAESMGADVTSSEIAVENLDFIAFEATWSGGSTPVGELTVQGQVSTQWATLDVTSQDVSGASGARILQAKAGTLDGVKAVRLRYARTSGTGTLSAVVAGGTRGA